jgi:hypothetical protein
MQSRGLPCQTRIGGDNPLTRQGIAHGGEYPGKWRALIRPAHINERVIYRDGRMKQAHSETTRHRPTSRWWAGESVTLSTRRRTDRPFEPGVREIEPSSSWSFGHMFVALLGALWFVTTLPFRLVFWIIAWMGRLAALVLGFSLMVVGMALWAGPLFFIGIPLFLVGLVLTLRCLD